MLNPASFMGKSPNRFGFFYRSDYLICQAGRNDWHRQAALNRNTNKKRAASLQKKVARCLCGMMVIGF